MTNNTSANEAQIRDILEEYLGKRKAEKVAKETLEAINSESRHTHKGRPLYVNTDKDGKYILSTESRMKVNVKRVLIPWLSSEEVEESVDIIMDYINRCGI